MEEQNFTQKVKSFFIDKKEKFNGLSKGTKSAILVGVVGVILATTFSINYGIKNKYDVLFSGLDSYDAANITKQLEDKSIDTKIEGDTIYVPKKEVDKLRIELSSSITNGSKGFEIMDESSGFGMTDDEFQIKKQRMLQGEIEKTIKTFPQVEDARVHITNGEESVFSKESTPGKAAVYVNLKTGQYLEKSQVRSIMSLVSASSTNIPKNNVEVIDQSMALLSEGIFDEDGNVLIGSTANIQNARQAEKELNEDLQKEINNMLEPIFGAGKVKSTVNSTLDFDVTETTEIKIDPEKVILNESRSENSASTSGQTGSPVDNNMSNTGEGSGTGTTSKEEHIEYEVGKTETKTISTPGEVKKITASVAIDGVVDPAVMSNVESMVAGAIGMDPQRGDSISVVSMEFDVAGKEALANAKLQEEKAQLIKTVGMIAAAAILLIGGIASIIYLKNRKRDLDEFEQIDEIALMDKKLQQMQESTSNFIDENSEGLTLEDEVKIFASKNPDEATELIKIWLNE
ncbi:MAG: flagellar basal-body MS-ring/collar protein FliF [Peptostreptococcaceae bacterium]